MISDKFLDSLDPETASHIKIMQADQWMTPDELGKACDIHSVAKKYMHPEEIKLQSRKLGKNVASEKQVGRIDVSAATSVGAIWSVARCWQQWITEGRVYCRGGQDVPGTQMIARMCNQKSGHFGTNNVASIDSTPLTSFQTSRAIKRNHTTLVRSRRPLRRLPLTPHHRECRLDFCRPRATWSVTDWRRVIFSDESRSLSADDHRTRLEAHRPAVRSGIYCRKIQQFHKIRGRYFNADLLPMLSSRPGAIYQQDNARPHTARLSQQCLQGYDVLPWPARSPDLSPIEHVWTRWEGNCSRPRDTELTDAKTIAGYSTGGH
ncbi:transposable element Tc1 transposase [Trichonephila clavipes]|nr:transposable element Tc1 transposase [Trichonephila clavipes]